MKVNLTEKQQEKLKLLALSQVDKIFAALKKLQHERKCPHKYRDIMLGDCADHLQFYYAICDGDFTLAYRIQEKMDTHVQDNIPVVIFNMIDNCKFL